VPIGNSQVSVRAASTELPAGSRIRVLRREGPVLGPHLQRVADVQAGAVQALRQRGRARLGRQREHGDEPRAVPCRVQLEPMAVAAIHGRELRDGPGRPLLNLR
jgi:hypothetical protein